MLKIFAFFILSFFSFTSFSQNNFKKVQAKRLTGTIKIDGFIDDNAWKDASLVTGLVQQRPNPGQSENFDNRTEIYITYDNTSVYIGGFCHELTSDSISKELNGRDSRGINDIAGVFLDTYNDKINAVGFFVTPYGEQHDRKYSPNLEDLSWNAVWESASKIHDNGWTFEMRIPYSALRFVSQDNQTWGLNFIRRRVKQDQIFFWNEVNPNVNGLINQEGEWNGIQKIEAPVRLSFSPYLSGYINHFKKDTKEWRNSFNGGMDVKYGISDAFTLDMTLIPDFGQVQSDNKVLNLSPFEVKYNENRAFFTEGTELFNKGNLFYSRRVGGRPLHFYDVNGSLSNNDSITKNPIETKLINATKVSGRTKKGLGIGFFNAITRPIYAEVKDKISNDTRQVETNPLTNYNIIVLDQNLKNNSSVSFVNTNVLRNGSDYDANVSAVLFNLNTKNNIFNWNGKFAVSHLSFPSNPVNGYSHTVGFGKTGGRWNFQLTEELADDKYAQNDLGYFTNNNFINHSFWMGYRWVKPTGWYNNIYLNYNANYSSLFKNIPGQKIDSKYQSFSTNINANGQLKNLWQVGMYIGYGLRGNDFYEPRAQGYSFRTSRRLQFEGWFNTNTAKKYSAGLDYFIGLRSLFNSPNQSINFSQNYRFNHKFSIGNKIYFNPVRNDAGYYGQATSILFSRRDINTIENVFSAKYNFSNKSGITFRARHYWSEVEHKQLYNLNEDGSLTANPASSNLQHQNFNLFNIDAVYTWQFAPGSFVNIVWKDESFMGDNNIGHSYFKNFDNTISSPQNNNLSVKIIYYLDYLELKKWRHKS